jgi:hypothetical protein
MIYHFCHVMQMNPILLFQEPAPSSTLEEELNGDDVDNEDGKDK